MARTKTKLDLPKRRLLADLAEVTTAWAEAGAERERLILRAKDARIPVDRIATASGLTTNGVEKLVKRLRQQQASGS